MTGQQNSPQDGKIKTNNVMKSQKQTKKILNICGNHTYLIKIERKTIWRGDFRPNLTINHPSPVDQEEEKEW
jgi:hypothetical protein